MDSISSFTMYALFILTTFCAVRVIGAPFSSNLDVEVRGESLVARSPAVSSLRPAAAIQEGDDEPMTELKDSVDFINDWPLKIDHFANVSCSSSPFGKYTTVNGTTIIDAKYGDVREDARLANFPGRSGWAGMSTRVIDLGTEIEDAAAEIWKKAELIDDKGVQINATDPQSIMSTISQAVKGERDTSAPRTTTGQEIDFVTDEGANQQGAQATDWTMKTAASVTGLIFTFSAGKAYPLVIKDPAELQLGLTHVATMLGYLIKKIAKTLVRTILPNQYVDLQAAGQACKAILDAVRSALEGSAQPSGKVRATTWGVRVATAAVLSGAAAGFKGDGMPSPSGFTAVPTFESFVASPDEQCTADST